MVISIYFIIVAREEALFLGAKTLQTLRDAACAAAMPGLVLGMLGSTDTSSSRGGTNQSLAGLLATGDVAEIRAQVGNIHRPFLTRKHLVFCHDFGTGMTKAGHFGVSP